MQSMLREDKTITELGIEKLTWGLAAAMFSLCIFASFFVK